MMQQETTRAAPAQQEREHEGRGQRQQGNGERKIMTIVITLPTEKNPTVTSRKDPDASRLRVPERKRHSKRTREKGGRQNQSTAAKKICTSVAWKTTDNTTIEQNKEREQSKQREKEIKQTTKKHQAEENHQVRRPEQRKQRTYTQQQQVENRDRAEIHVIPPSGGGGLGELTQGENKNQDRTPTNYNCRQDKEKQEGGDEKEAIGDREKQEESTKQIRERPTRGKNQAEKEPNPPNRNKTRRDEETRRGTADRKKDRSEKGHETRRHS